MQLKEFKDKFDPLLIEFIEKKIKLLQIYKSPDLTKCLSHLKKLLGSGKRIRPYLSFLSYKAYGGTKDKDMMKLLVFMEIFHAFCLVHDDIMDKADKRHGIETFHMLIKPPSLGNSIAILIGDFLFSWAFEILLTNKDFDQEKLERTKEIFLKMIDEVITGQFIDINLTGKKTSTEEEIYQKMFLKTASYSFIRPLMIGKALVGEIKDEKFFQEFGKSLGFAFQIQDDLFDIIYDTDEIFKSSFNDVQQRQHTIFTNYIFEKGTNKQKTVLQTYFGKKIEDKDKNKLIKIFNDSKSLEYGKKLIKGNLEKAKKLLKEESMIDTYKNNLLEFIDILNQRKS
ncbi:MAG: polyprenyl synthetase family protein [Patescibacteria group bacterium]